MSHVTDYMTTEQVCGALAEAGVDPATVGRIFAQRLQPQNLDDPDKKFVIGVPLDSEQALLVVYRFGLGKPLKPKTPLDESGPDWRPRWLSVEGPFKVELNEKRQPLPDCEVMLKAKELTNG